tara:strand:+ start:292 stop:684 length:393 start_codon:yes stop_codon:yes gene_type:complete
MAVTQGTAIVWGTASTDVVSTAIATGTVSVTGEDFAREADKNEIRGADGSISSIYYYNQRNTLSLKVYPSGSSADADSLPALGEKVTITAAGDSDLAGDWIADSVSKSRKVDGIVEFDLGLTQYSGITPA